MRNALTQDARLKRKPASRARPTGAARASRSRLAIVKLGGSHATGPHLGDWLAAIAAEAGSIAIVPGGGPFADAVRSAQASIGFDDRAAHAMALMAMAQFGAALVSLNPALRLAASRSAILRALRDGKVPVWSPEPMARAAGVAGKLGPHLRQPRRVARRRARRRPPRARQARPVRCSDAARAEDLAARGVVDPLFPRYLKESGARAWLAGPPTARDSPKGCGAPCFLKSWTATFKKIDRRHGE